MTSFIAPLFVCLTTTAPAISGCDSDGDTRGDTENGAFESIIQAGGAMGDECVFDVDTLDDGSFYAVGFFSGATVFGAGQSEEATIIADEGEDGFISKFSPDGSIVWLKSVSSASDVAVQTVRSLDDGSLLILGTVGPLYDEETTVTFANGEESETTLAMAAEDDQTRKTFAAKYNSDGSLVFAKIIASCLVVSPFSGGAIAQDGSFWISDGYQENAEFGDGVSLNSPRATFLAKFDGNAQLITAFDAVTHVNSSTYGWNHNLATSEDGSFAYLADSFKGTILLEPGGEGETSLTGFGELDFYLARFDSEGALQWVNHGMTDTCWPEDIAATSDGVILTGYGTEGLALIFEDTPTEILDQQRSHFVSKINDDGSFGWATTIKGGEFPVVAVDEEEENVFVSGLIDGSVLFESPDTDTASLELNATGDAALYFSSFDKNGSVKWAHSANAFGGNTWLDNAAVSVFSNGTPLFAGYFDGSLVFNEGRPNETTLTSTRYDVFFTQIVPED